MKVWSFWLCVIAAVYGQEVLQVDELDEQFIAKMQETQRAFVGVEQQLSAAREVLELFILEDTQLQMFALETRAKLAVIQEEVKGEMEDAMLEVEHMRQEAVANATAWMKTLQELKEATHKNELMLQDIREKNRQVETEMQMQKLKAERELELLQELEEQREVEKKLEKQAEQEMKRLQEIEKQREFEKLQIQKQKELDELRELEKQRKLEQLQAQKKEQELQLEREKTKELKQHGELEMQIENKVEKEASSTDLTTNNDGVEMVAMPSDVAEDTSIVNREMAWYASAEQSLLDATTAVYRQLVLPVVAILSLFLVLTVVIAKYNSMKQARRNRRVLYSGYPKSYRPKTKQEMTADEKPRLHYPNKF